MDIYIKRSVHSYQANALHQHLRQWNGLFSRVVYIGDPDMIMKIAMANWPKASIQYDGFKPLNGNALFVQLNHDRWRIQRKRLEPAFQHHVIRAQHEAFSKHLEVSRLPKGWDRD